MISLLLRMLVGNAERSKQNLGTVTLLFLLFPPLPLLLFHPLLLLPQPLMLLRVAVVGVAVVIIVAAVVIAAPTAIPSAAVVLSLLGVKTSEV